MMAKKLPKRLKNHARITLVAGWSFIILAVLYSLLHLSFSIVGGHHALGDSTAEILNKLSVIEQADYILLMLISFVPIFLITGALGLYSSLKFERPTLSGLMLIFFSLSAICFTVGLGRWHVFYYSILQKMPLSDASTDSDSKTILFEAIERTDTILGFWIGQLGAEILLYFAIFVLGICLRNSYRFPLWLAYLSIIVSVFGFVGVGRYSSALGQFMFDVNSALSLAPLLFIALGIGLLRFTRPSKQKKFTKRRKTTIDKKNIQSESASSGDESVE